ncbi:prolyl oligopeptidase family serine peptidase [Flammeovirgaceae bacterium SG7u.111]|nr:prolyl oligopeptidase family serine peptidase [Flammeovirgaceae bacterium SG7u.132]WPO36003.1 prolyl oligopeptidase family serine peptidase [Flammeovirgaceae bacterium SG7u.111]
MKRTILLLLITFNLNQLSLHAQNMEAYERKVFVEKNDTLLYRLLLPENFDETKKYPLLIFLHGAGERGNDNQKQLLHGGKLFLEQENREKFPAIVIFPQCPQENYWAAVDRKVNQDGSRTFTFPKNGKPSKPMALALKLLDSYLKQNFVDKSRVYIGGLSMGGMGTFDMVSRKPNVFAAAFPICGGDNPASAKKYAKKVDFWVFHGAKDDVVPPAFSENMVEAIRKQGGNVKLTIYPEANHNSWDSAFAEPELLPWIFSTKKN